jgi:hypothetical protein
MITVSLTKAKSYVHELRRSARGKEFAPFDDAIAKHIPGELENAEEARKLIRKKYEDIQKQIDTTRDLRELKNIMNQWNFN